MILNMFYYLSVFLRIFHINFLSLFSLIVQLADFSIFTFFTIPIFCIDLLGEYFILLWLKDNIILFLWLIFFQRIGFSFLIQAFFSTTLFNWVWVCLLNILVF